MSRRSTLKSAIDAAVMLVAVVVAAMLFRDFLPQYDWQGELQVIDGDSLRRGGKEIRLYGIDAPEYRQTCDDAMNRPYPCGREAASALRRLVAGHEVSCRTVETDRYLRDVSLCEVDGSSLNEAMVRDGWATAYLRHSMDFVAIEAEARADRKGIWQGTFESPEEYRRRSRDLVRGELVWASTADED
jgi:endonuclease YncB( thermonuclease family)